MVLSSPFMAPNRLYNPPLIHLFTLPIIHHYVFDDAM